MARAGNNHKGGRPKGKKEKKTLEKEAILKAFRERAMRHADVLFSSQITLARGQTFLYKIEKEWVSNGNKGFYRKLKPQLVTSQVEIEEYLEGLIEEGNADDDSDPAATYYYLTTKEPDNSAIDSILDRTFGRPSQHTDITSGGESLTTFANETQLQRIAGRIRNGGVPSHS